MLAHAVEREAREGGEGGAGGEVQHPTAGHQVSDKGAGQPGRCHGHQCEAREQGVAGVVGERPDRHHGAGPVHQGRQGPLPEGGENAGDGRFDAGGGGEIGFHQLEGLAVSGEAGALGDAHDGDQRPSALPQLLHQFAPQAAAGAGHDDDTGGKLVGQGHDIEAGVQQSTQLILPGRGQRRVEPQT